MAAKDYGLSLVTAPKASPLELEKVRTDHLRVPVTTDAGYIQQLIDAARKHVEEHAQRALIDSTWRMRLDRFPVGSAALVLPLGNATAITAISYTDSAGNAATWDVANVKLSADRSPPVVRPARGKSWPAASVEPDAVSITFTAGVTKVEDVPADLAQAMLLLIGHWYENREAVVVGTMTKEIERAVDALLAPYALDYEFEELGT